MSKGFFSLPLKPKNSLEISKDFCQLVKFPKFLSTTLQKSLFVFFGQLSGQQNDTEKVVYHNACLTLLSLVILKPKDLDDLIL